MSNVKDEKEEELPMVVSVNRDICLIHDRVLQIPLSKYGLSITITIVHLFNSSNGVEVAREFNQVLFTTSMNFRFLAAWQYYDPWIIW